TRAPSGTMSGGWASRGPPSTPASASAGGSAGKLSPHAAKPARLRARQATTVDEARRNGRWVLCARGADKSSRMALHNLDRRHRVAIVMLHLALDRHHGGEHLTVAPGS